LWEKSFSNLGLTTSNPSVMKVDDKWFAVVGSGPTSYEGTSTQTARMYVMDLYTGAYKKDWPVTEADSFMGAGPVTVDMGLNYNVDTGFIGTAYQQGTTWKGRVYRFRVPKLSGDWRTPAADDVYDTNPNNWTFSRVMDAEGPITASPGVSIDNVDNLWVYFGTGRFYADGDKTDTSQNYFYGIKDPFYNKNMFATSTAAAAKVIGHTELQDATPIKIYTDKTITGGPTSVGTWAQLLTYMKNKNGWRISLGQTVPTQGERVLNKPVVLGGVVFDTTFVPNQNPCGYDGDSFVLGVYYETGTAWIEEIFVGGSTEETVGGQKKVALSSRAYIGVGRGSNVSIHVGMQEGATGFIQQSTGIVHSMELNPALKIRSGFVYWRER
jgi:type IV pilus assembly protein PilY1